MTETDEARRAAIVRQWEHIDDAGMSHELYHDDAVLEVPQSGERFEGVANFRAGGSSTRCRSSSASVASAARATCG